LLAIFCVLGPFACHYNSGTYYNPTFAQRVVPVRRSNEGVGWAGLALLVLLQAPRPRGAMLEVRQCDASASPLRRVRPPRAAVAINYEHAPGQPRPRDQVRPERRCDGRLGERLFRVRSQQARCCRGSTLPAVQPPCLGVRRRRKALQNDALYLRQHLHLRFDRVRTAARDMAMRLQPGLARGTTPRRRCDRWLVRYQNLCSAGRGWAQRDRHVREGPGVRQRSWDGHSCCTSFRCPLIVQALHRVHAGDLSLTRHAGNADVQPTSWRASTSRDAP